MLTQTWKMKLVHYSAGLRLLMTSPLDINVFMQLQPVYQSFPKLCFALLLFGLLKIAAS